MNRGQERRTRLHGLNYARRSATIAAQPIMVKVKKNLCEGRAMPPLASVQSLGLQARDAFVLQYPNDHPAVFSFAISGFVFANLATLAHGARCQHIGQRNIALL